MLVAFDVERQDESTNDAVHSSPAFWAYGTFEDAEGRKTRKQVIGFEFKDQQDKLNMLNSLLSLLEAEYMETWANMNPVQAYAMRNGTTIDEAEVEMKHNLLPEGEKEVA